MYGTVFKWCTDLLHMQRASVCDCRTVNHKQLNTVDFILRFTTYINAHSHTDVNAFDKLISSTNSLSALWLPRDRRIIPMFTSETKQTWESCKWGWADQIQASGGSSRSACSWNQTDVSDGLALALDKSLSRLTYCSCHTANPLCSNACRF